MDILSIREDFISGKVDLISFYTDVIKRIEDKKDLNIFLDFSKEKIMERVEFLNNKLKNWALFLEFQFLLRIIF